MYVACSYGLPDEYLAVLINYLQTRAASVIFLGTTALRHVLRPETANGGDDRQDHEPCESRLYT